MSKHTSGPWAIYVNAPSDIVIRKMSKDGYELCSIARVSSGYANARLIAAAPELLEALKEAHNALELFASDESPSGQIAVAAVMQASAAIAKATGENT